jgi:hypothetical protein
MYLYILYHIIVQVFILYYFLVHLYNHLYIHILYSYILPAVAKSLSHKKSKSLIKTYFQQENKVNRCFCHTLNIYSSNTTKTF